MRCPGKEMHDEETDCPDCDGEGEIECCECGHYRKCRECDGDGDGYRIVTARGHLVPCEICDNAEGIPGFVAEWIATQQLAAISRDAQRGIIQLHNKGRLLHPPRVADYGVTMFCVALTYPLKRAAAQIAELVPGATALDPEGIVNLPMWLVGAVLARDGLWCLLDARPPTYAEVIAFVREARSLADAAA